MAEPVFPDKSHSPTDADLKKVLGRTKTHWDKLSAYAAEAAPDHKPEWKYYSKKSGWIFVVRGKRRNLVYMCPLAKCFSANFAFGEKAVKATEASDLPADVVKMVRNAPKYPEGRAVRYQVKTAADVKVVKKLILIKIGN